MQRYAGAVDAGILSSMGKPRRAIVEGATERRVAMATRLSQLRTVLNGNQAAVARLIGVGVNTWNRYEKAARDIDPYALAEFCKVFGVSGDWVLLGDLYSLPKEVIAQLVAAYPEIVRQEDGRRKTPPKSHRSADMQEQVALS